MTVLGGDVTYASDLNGVESRVLELNLHAWGQRLTDSSSTSGTTELAVLRVDSLDLKAGKFYEVRTGNLRPDLTTATDRVKVTLRYSSSGAATTSSLEIGRVESATVGDLNSLPSFSGWLAPTSDEATASVLLSISRPTGAGTFFLEADPNRGIEIFVICHGDAPGNTGVAL